MEQVLLVIQVILAVGLIGMVLIQRSDSDGFGLGGNSGGGLLSGRAQANLMTRTTAILAALFIINSLALSVIASQGRSSSIMDAIDEQQKTDAAGAPVVPVDGDKKTEKKLAPAGKKTDAKDAPVVPTDTDENVPVKEKPAAKEVDKKPAAPVKKPVKKAAPKVDAADEPAPADHNDE